MFSIHYLKCLEWLMTALRGLGCDIIQIRLEERCHILILTIKKIVMILKEIEI